MPYSKTEIANMALASLGHGKRIGDLDTENSAEARVCRVFWDISVETALRDFDWPFASKIADLGLVEEDPNDEWAYSYRYPSDCVKLKRILSGTRVDNETTAVKLKVSRDYQGLLVFTDQDDAQAEYTMRVSETTQWSGDFTMAHVYKLASLIAPEITIGDKGGVSAKVEAKYMQAISSAKRVSNEEETPDLLPEAEYIRARE